MWTRLAPLYAHLAPGLEKSSLRLPSRDARVSAELAGIAATGQFEAAETSTFAWSQTHDTGGWVDHLNTHSDHRVLPQAQRERLLAAVAQAIDAIGGSFETPCEAVLVSARKG